MPWDLSHGSGKRATRGHHLAIGAGPARTRDIDKCNMDYGTLENNKGIINKVTNKSRRTFCLVLVNSLQSNLLKHLITCFLVIAFLELRFFDWPGCQAGMQTIYNHCKFTIRLFVEPQIPTINKNNNIEVSSRHSKMPLPSCRPSL